jgi:hypothetical protein
MPALVQGAAPGQSGLPASSPCCTYATEANDAAVTLPHHWHYQQNFWRSYQTHEVGLHVAFASDKQVGKAKARDVVLATGVT